MKTKTFTYNLESIDSVSKELFKCFNSKIVLFNGEMGAGKTTLVKSLAKVLGCKDIVTSPTFSIVNEYALVDDKIYHFDFYRIESIEDAYNFGVEDYLYSDNWVFIEWSERIESLLPSDVCKIDINTQINSYRTLKLTIDTQNLTKNNAYEQLK